MSLVVDASVAMKWFVEEAGSPQAAFLLTTADLLIAPDLIVAELANATWKAVRAGTMLAEQQDYAAIHLASLLDELVPLAPLARRAIEISRTIDHPAYDCFYLALLEQRDASLVTADRRLLQRCAATEWKDRVTDLHGLPSQ